MTIAAYRLPSIIPSDFSVSPSLDSHSSPSRARRFCFGWTKGSVEMDGCQNIRSGLSPEASLVGTFCSYGSGMACASTLAPVAFSKASMTCFGAFTVFCAVHMVSFTPSRRAVGSTFVCLPPESEEEPESPAVGSLHAVADRAAAHMKASAGRALLFMVCLSRTGSGRRIGKRSN